MKVKHTYIPEEGKTICTLQVHNLEFTGEAQCHPDDKDYMSEFSGGVIAESRATIKYLQHTKNNVIKPGLRSLEHFMSCLKQKKDFNSESLEAQALAKEISNHQKQLREINENINNVRKSLKAYIDEKDKFYQYLRSKKKKGKN